MNTPTPVRARRIASRRLHRAGIVWLTLSCVAAALPSRPSRAQSPTPVPGPTAAPTTMGTPLPPVTSVVGVMPSCTFFASLSSSDDVVVAGDPVTVTVTTDVTCPQLFDGRAAVLVVGSRTRSEIQDVRASLVKLVQSLAAGTGTRLAVVDVGRPVHSPPWASTPAAIAALVRPMREIEVATDLDEAAWMDALTNTSALLGAARPSERPFLIVLDSSAPAGGGDGQTRVVERLQAVARAVRESAGHVWLLDLSSTGWLAGQIFRPPLRDSTVVGLFPAADQDGTLGPLLERLLASAASPITVVHTVLSVKLPVGAEKPVTVPRASSATVREVMWFTTDGGHRQSLRLSAVFRTVAAMADGIATARVTIQRSLPTNDVTQRTNDADVCVDRPPAEAALCRRTATPSATPSPRPTAGATATAPVPLGTLFARASQTVWAGEPSRTPEPSGTPVPSTATPRDDIVRGKAWLPIAHSTLPRAAAVPSRGAGATAPKDMPDAPNDPGPEHGTIGGLLECSLVATLRSSHSVVVAGDPVTLTVTADIDCPQLLDHRAAVLVVGGRTQAQLDDVRASLGALVEALAVGERTRLAVVEVGDPGTPTAWASTHDDFAALATRLRSINVRAATGDTEWLTALERARRTIDDARPSERPLLIVLDGTGPSREEIVVVRNVLALAEATREAVGQVWFLDRSDSAWLFDAIQRPNPMNGTLIGLCPSLAGDDVALESLLLPLLASAAAPLALVHARLMPLLPVVDEAPFTNPAADRATAADVSWTQPADGHFARLRWTATFRTARPVADGGALATVDFERRMADSQQFGSTNGVSVCVEQRPPTALRCGPATPTQHAPPSRGTTPAPPATSIPVIVRNRIWLPQVMRHP